MILDDDNDDDDDEEDDDEAEDNDKDDDNNDKCISALWLDRDLRFLRGYQGCQRHRPHKNDDDEEDEDKVEDNDKDDNNNKAQWAVRGGLGLKFYKCLFSLQCLLTC